MTSYAFWNNKGGTGKTSLAFQAICAYAFKNPDEKILVIDVCPQANLSELLLGGLEGAGSDNLLKIQGLPGRATIGGYFQSRLPKPYDPHSIHPHQYMTTCAEYNPEIPENIHLIAGDPMLELQANAMSTLANNQIPGTNTWASVVSWVIDLLNALEDEFDTVFLDTNPSFSIYTQTALAASDRVILPVMADDSSRRAIQNAFSLMYGLRLPSDIYEQHLFATRMKDGGLVLPKAHLIVKNRLTQYMGPASAYAAVLRSIEADVRNLLKDHSEHMSFKSANDAFVDVRDFQTTGVVAFARGTPFYRLKAGKRQVGGRRVVVNEPMRKQCVESIDDVVEAIQR